jgi:hypothetical protein
MKTLRLCAVATLFAACNPAIAATYGGTIFSLIPAAPATGQLVEIRLEAENGCSSTSGGAATVNLEAKTILFSTSSTDTNETPCPLDRQTPRSVIVGALPRGTYTVTYQVCGFLPPPLGPCATFGTETLLVGGGDPVQVAATSPAGVATLVALLALAGLAASRARNAGAD